MRKVAQFWNYKQPFVHGLSLPIFASLKAVAGRTKNVFLEKD
jgi:hypothetical protein